MIQVVKINDWVKVKIKCGRNIVFLLKFDNRWLQKMSKITLQWILSNKNIRKWLVADLGTGDNILLDSPV